jgi:GDPmannose 4,6-dehydratase
MRALITGITGQDGSYLAEFLLSKGYKVFGLVRRTSQESTKNIQHILNDVTLLDGDLLDQGSINRAVFEAVPDEIYNLASQSFVGSSFSQPVLTADVTGIGALRVFEAARLLNPKAKIYQASSSEMFGNQPGQLNEQSTLRPRSPYGAAKLFAHSTAINYRESYGMFICCGILFNHESPRRGAEFVTQKIAQAAKRIASEGGKLKLGNLTAARDWGDSRDYVRAMWLMLQQANPDDYVVATGVTHTIKDVCNVAFTTHGLNWESYVETDQKFMRPADIELLWGDPTKAKEVLGWKPEISFEAMIREMSL